MEWRTRFTELVGCKYPIMEGALTGVGNWELAAAISKAGGEGCLTAAVSGTPEKLREDIRKIREEVEHFATNISIGACPHLDEMLQVCIEERVPTIETAGPITSEYAERIKKSGITWIHKVATLKHLKRSEELGADAVVLVGLDGYGFKSIYQLPTFTAIAWASRQVKIPLIAAGGIGDARTFLGALALGAEGIYMGTAFLVAKECPIREDIKQNIIKAQPDHPDLILELLAPPKPKDYKDVMNLKGKVPLERWMVALEWVMLKHEWKDVKPLWEQEIADVPAVGDRLKGPYSFACGYLDRVVTCEELIEQIINGAEDILKRWVTQFKLT